MMLRLLSVRMLAVAMVPLVLVVLLVVGLMWSARTRDIVESHEQQGRLLLGQLTRSSEYGLFSENLGSLKSIVSAVRREPYVAVVAIFDARGRLLIAEGTDGPLDWNQVRTEAYQQQRAQNRISVFTASVMGTEVTPEDDLYAQPERRTSTPPVLGHVLVELSQVAVTERERNALWSAIGIALTGALAGALLASLLARRVMMPIRKLSSNIERVGQGDFRPVTIRSDDPLGGLQQKLNRMALQLAAGRMELERQIAEATQEISIQRDEAQTANRAKSQFLAAASHDLRQPTHALGMFVARLSQLPLEKQAAEIVHYLGASVQSMQDLLDELLDVSRLESGTVKPQIRPCALQDILREVEMAASPLAEEKGLRLRVRASDRWALTDPILLRRTLMNLVHNAIRYTPHGTVLVSCRSVADGTQVRIDVHDSGIGIAKEHHDEIFREFFQADNPERDRGKGLGLGLNIVQRTCALLGHAVTLRSAPGCGSRFSVTVAQCPAAPLHGFVPPPSVATDTALWEMKVLVLENDTLAREALVNLLRSWGCDVASTHHLSEALALANANEPPHLILSDYRLGLQGNGLEAIQAIRRKLGRDVPACLVSGDTDPDLIRRVADSGLLLLHKPVRPAKLRSILRHLRD